MPRVINLQTSFNSGVLDPRLAARTDVKHFYQGAAEAENVQSLPQGGMKRRPGFKYVDAINEEARLAAFAFNVEQTYLLVFTVNNIAVYMDDVFQADITTTYTVDELFELQWTQSADTMIIVHESHQPKKVVRGLTHTSWSISNIDITNIPKYKYSKYQTKLTAALTTAGTTATVASTTDFSASGFISIKHEVMSYSGKTATTFTGLGRGADNTTAVAHAVNDVAFDTEAVWSATRGWPKSATFYQGRLWFGGSGSRPQTLWGSVTNDFYNFDVGSSLDDEALDLTLDTDQVNAITAVYAGRHLQIFTTGGEFSINDLPITPAKSSVRRQSLFGSSYIPPKSIDGATIFVDRTGKSVREFLYAYAEDAYTSGTVSLLASHLLNSPIDMDTLRGTGSADANYVYFVNYDGTVAVYNSLRAQEVGGWTKWTTNGYIESVSVVVEEVYFIVARYIDGVLKRYLERLDPDSYTDANVRKTQTSSATVTGLAHLNGEECRVRSNGSILNNSTPSSGQITMDSAGSEVEVGLNYNTKIKTMPVNQDFQDGSILTRRKRIVRVDVNLYESLGVSVSDEYMSDRSFGMNLGSGVEPFTGIKEIFLLGYTDLAQIEITQSDPVPMTLLGIGLEVEA